MFPYQAEYEMAVECAQEAGSLIMAAFEKNKQLTFKGETDIVTEVDKACEQLVMDKIRSKFPTHLFVAEETVSEGNGVEELTDAPTWLIDPIDGTTNFVHRLPFSCISIGFAVGKVMQAGVVFSPMLNLLYTARRGQGAQRNGQPISVSETTELKRCLVSTGFPYERDDHTLDFLLGHVKATLQAVRDVRRCGSAALDMCFVAQGTFEAYYEHGIHAWDVAAGSLIVEEAGGSVACPWRPDFDFCARQVLVASSPQIIEKLKAVWKAQNLPASLA